MVVASSEHMSRFEQIVLVESRSDRQRRLTRLRVQRHRIDVLDREGRRARIHGQNEHMYAEMQD